MNDTEWIPGYEAQAIIASARQLSAEDAGAELLRVVTEGQVTVRCQRRIDDDYLVWLREGDPARFTSRPPRPTREQVDAPISADDWNAFFAYAADVNAADIPGLHPNFVDDRRAWTFEFMRHDMPGLIRRTRLEGVEFRRSEMKRLATTAPSARFSDAAVSRWLATRFADEETKSASKSILRNLAIEAFPGLSVRRFDVIWSNAAPEDRRKGGRPRKPQH